MSSLRELLTTNRDFRRLFLAAIVAEAGGWFAFVALAKLVTALTGQPGAPAYVFAATVLPMFLATPIAGAIADRYDRKYVLAIANVVRVPLTLLLCVAAAWGSVPLTFATVIALGIAAMFHDPVTNAVTPNLVPPEHLAPAQMLMGAVWGSMLFVGAGLGGLVAELLGIQAAFVINAAAFAVSAWLIAGIRTPMQEARGDAEVSAPFGDAIRYIRRDPVVSRLILAKIGVSSANGTVGLLPAFASAKFSGTSIATGLLFAARGLGALLGPILARVIAGSAPRPRAIVVICGVSTLLYVAVYALIPITPWFWLAMVLVALAHLGGGAQWTMSVYGLQVATPDAMRGRVMSIDYGLATFAIGTSSVIAGVLADLYGEASATWWLVGAGAVYAIAWMIWALTGIGRATRDGS